MLAEGFGACGGLLRINGPKHLLILLLLFLFRVSFVVVVVRVIFLFRRVYWNGGCGKEEERGTEERANMGREFIVLKLINSKRKRGRRKKEEKGREKSWVM